MKKLLFLLFLGSQLHAADMDLMKYCYDNYHPGVQRRMGELFQGDEEDVMDALTAGLYISYKCNDIVSMNYYIQRIEAHLHKCCAE